MEKNREAGMHIRSINLPQKYEDIPVSSLLTLLTIYKVFTNHVDFYFLNILLFRDSEKGFLDPGGFQRIHEHAKL